MTNGLIGGDGDDPVFEEYGTAGAVTVIEAGLPLVQAGTAAPAQIRARRSSTSKARWVTPRRPASRSPQVLRVVTVNGEAPRPPESKDSSSGRAGQGPAHQGPGIPGVGTHHFHGGPATHGNTRHRKPGSISPGTDPSRVIKGKRMPGHMGAERHTELGLRVVRVDPERNLLFVRGAVPGSKNGIVTVAKQGGPSRHD